MTPSVSIRFIRLAADALPSDAMLGAALAFRATPEQVAKMRLQAGSDDLDDFEAAYFVGKGVPIGVLRYAHAPEGEFTFMVDLRRARSLPATPVVFGEAFLKSWLGAGGPSILWRSAASELPDQSNEQVPQRDVSLEFA